MARPQGQSRVPPPPSDRRVNTGTVSVPPPGRRQHDAGGWVHRRPIGSGRGGAVVVVRGRESRPHGEGRQRYREGMDAVMAADAPVNIGAPPVREFPVAWVSQIQAKLHGWAVADPGRRFDDLFNLVHDPATLMVAWAPGRGEPGCPLGGIGRPDGRLGRDRDRASRSSWTTCVTSCGRAPSSAAGAGTEDPQTRRAGNYAGWVSRPSPTGSCRLR